MTETQADRLKKLRAALGLKPQLAMAQFLGVELARYSNMERGLPLTFPVALAIVQKVPGITLDWLFIGRSGGLSIDWGRRLGLLPPINGEPNRRKRLRR